MFYLLLFCVFDDKRLSQKTLEDTFNSSEFKALFGLAEQEKYVEVLPLKDFRKSIPIILKQFTGKPIQNKRGNIHYREEKEKPVSDW